MNIMVHKNHTDVLDKIYEHVRASDRQLIRNVVDVDLLDKQGRYLPLRLIDSCMKERHVAVRADEVLRYEKFDGFCAMTLSLNGLHVPVRIGVNPYFSGYRHLEPSSKSKTLRDFLRSESIVSDV